MWTIYSVLYEAYKGIVLAVLDINHPTYQNDFQILKEDALEWCKHNQGDLHNVFISTPILILVKRLTSDKFVPFKAQNIQEVLEAKTLKQFIIFKLQKNSGFLTEDLT